MVVDVGGVVTTEVGVPVLDGGNEGSSETGLAVGSVLIGTTVLGASVFRQLGSHGMIALKATVLNPSIAVISPQFSGTRSFSPDAMSPWKYRPISAKPLRQAAL
jgi:hypothetical protein